MNVSVRRAGLADLDMLMEWRMRVLSEVFPADKGDDRAQIRKNNEAYYREHLADGTHTACFAYDADSDEIVGCGGICYQSEMPSPDNLTGTNGYLMNIYVLPKCRGEGVGRKIVEFLLMDAKTQGVEKIYLESSEMAKGLYRGLGFSDMRDYMKL